MGEFSTSGKESRFVGKFNWPLLRKFTFDEGQEEVVYMFFEAVNFLNEF